MLVPVEVDPQMVFDEEAGAAIMYLRALDRDAILPIWTGPFEANAVSVELWGEKPPRPMTHDLLKTTIHRMGGVVDRVVVSALREDTYYATIFIKQARQEIAIDARPSDAFSLALRAKAPIYVDEMVLREALEDPRIDELVSRWRQQLH